MNTTTPLYITAHACTTHVRVYQTTSNYAVTLNGIPCGGSVRLLYVSAHVYDAGGGLRQ